MHCVLLDDGKESNTAKRVMFSYFDDKRYILHDGIHTFAYFDNECKKQDDVIKYSHRWS